MRLPAIRPGLLNRKDGAVRVPCRPCPLLQSACQPVDKVDDGQWPCAGGDLQRSFYCECIERRANPNGMHIASAACSEQHADNSKTIRKNGAPMSRFFTLSAVGLPGKKRYAATYCHALHSKSASQIRRHHGCTMFSRSTYVSDGVPLLFTSGRFHYHAISWYCAQQAARNNAVMKFRYPCIDAVLAHRAGSRQSV